MMILLKPKLRAEDGSSLWMSSSSSSSSSSSFSSYRCASYAATGQCVSTCFYFPVKVWRKNFDIHCSHCTKIPHTSNNFLKRGWNHNWSQRRHLPPSFQSPPGRRFSRPCTTCNPTYPILLANYQEKKTLKCHESRSSHFTMGLSCFVWWGTSKVNCSLIHWFIIIWLVVYRPLKNRSSSIGIIVPIDDGKIIIQPCSKPPTSI